MTILTKNGMTAAELRSVAEKLTRSAASKKGRRTGSKVRKHLEDDLQAAVCTYLNTLERQGHLLYFAVPNGGKRNLLEAVRMKRLGVRRGIPDLVVIPKAGPWCFIELKSPKGVRSESQREWAEKLERFNCFTEVCRSLDEVKAFLFKAGVVRECAA